jgi:hypothetical protein
MDLKHLNGSDFFFTHRRHIMEEGMQSETKTMFARGMPYSAPCFAPPAWTFHSLSTFSSSVPVPSTHNRNAICSSILSNNSINVLMYVILFIDGFVCSTEEAPAGVLQLTVQWAKGHLVWSATGY